MCVHALMNINSSQPSAARLVVQSCCLFEPYPQALRTLADQVKRRERIKKQLLKNWKEQLQLVSGLKLRK